MRTRLRWWPGAPEACWLAGVLVVLLAAPAQAQQRERRDYTTPGLTLETGARTGACDAVLFTKDGNTLLACGDDKVVRSWPVGEDRFTDHRSTNLRWPTFREQRGAIFALALSPDEKRVAVAGFGTRATGEVMILDRATGSVVARVPDFTGGTVVWKAAFAPSGQTLVYGSDNGGIHVWDFADESRKGDAPPLAGSAGAARNRVRLITFLSDRKDETRFLTVAEDGRILRRDLARSKDEPVLVGKLGSQKTFRAAVGSGRRHLAAVSEVFTDFVEVAPLGDWLAGKKTPTAYYALPKAPATQIAHSVAVDDVRGRLLIGVRVEPRPDQKRGFIREVGGLIHVLDDYPAAIAGRKAPDVTLDNEFRPEQLAFRPGNAGQIASGGGPNHEVRLWSIAGGRARALDTIRSEGSCIWNVSLSPKGETLAFQSARKDGDPDHPGDYGGGPWRVLRIKGKSRRLAEAEKDFVPQPPALELDGWGVSFDRSGNLWEVKDPDGATTPLDNHPKRRLYNTDINNLPRCYTFLPGRTAGSVRLVVGHTWGASVYDCRRGEVRLARLLVGHEGDVMAVGATADGKTLVTASRDQTLCGWTLTDWPTSPELGASFRIQDGKIRVEKVDGGSPAWELGLSEGDELAGYFSAEGKNYNATGDPLSSFDGLSGGEDMTAEQALTRLGQVKANEEVLFSVTRWSTIRNGQPAHPLVKATVRQRPLWRLFPTRNNGYVMWRWRDFYYDTDSLEAEKLVGWHVNSGPGVPGVAARFFPLSQFGAPPLRRSANPKGEALSRFSPEKVWAVVQGSTESPELVMFPDLEPPLVSLTPATQAVKGTDAELAITARPAGRGARQKVVSATLWLDDYAPPIPLTPDPTGAIRVPKQLLDRKYLRSGANRVRVVAYNAAGGRGEATAVVTNDVPAPARVRMVGLVAGVNDYGATTYSDLTKCESDARAVHRLLEGQSAIENSPYHAADVTLLLGKKVTAAAIRERFADLAADRTLKREDCLVLFLAGHGDNVNAAGKQSEGDYFYVCSDTNAAKEATKLMAHDLARALAALPCRKLVILDTCHSGSIGADPVRRLIPESAPLLIFSSCKHTELAVEAKKGPHGLFTHAFLEGAGALPTPKGGPKEVRSGELTRYIRGRLPALLIREGARETFQNPVFEPTPLPDIVLFRKP